MSVDDNNIVCAMQDAALRERWAGMLLRMKVFSICQLGTVALLLVGREPQLTLFLKYIIRLVVLVIVSLRLVLGNEI